MFGQYLVCLYVNALGAISNWTIRSLMHDEKYFSDPHEFIPERHLKAGNETGATASLDPTAWVFGFGRRYVLLN